MVVDDNGTKNPERDPDDVELLCSRVRRIFQSDVLGLGIGSCHWPCSARLYRHGRSKLRNPANTLS